jgi:hypothetical protein
MYLVCFHSESGDRYHSIFEKEPSDEELEQYMVSTFPGEIEDGVCYVRVEEVIEFKDFDKIPIGVSTDNIKWL